MTVGSDYGSKRVLRDLYKKNLTNESLCNIQNTKSYHSFSEIEPSVRSRNGSKMIEQETNVVKVLGEGSRYVRLRPGRQITVLISEVLYLR